MEVAPFFVDFHHFLSIFTIFIDFHDLRTFVAIYILSQFTHFFRKFFLAKIAYSATSHVFCMYVKMYELLLLNKDVLCTLLPAVQALEVLFLRGLFL